MRPYRSMLFMPGHKADWVPKGVASGADALILDLEDSVPADLKDAARDAVGKAIGADRSRRVDLWVRPNPLVSGLMGQDLEAVVRHGLAGLFLPKVFSAI